VDPLMPALVLFLTILSINLIGDVLAERFNIRRPSDERADGPSGRERESMHPRNSLQASRRDSAGPLLEVENLRTSLRPRFGVVRAVDGVSFTLPAAARSASSASRAGQDHPLPLDHGLLPAAT
jgi:hypothetical protein